MKKFLIACLFIFGLIKSEAQNWAPAGLPGGFPYHILEFKDIYTDTINNIMYACGNNNQPGHIFRYNGSIWDTIGTFDNIIWGLTTYNGMLIVGGGFTNVNGQPDTSIAMFDGAIWHPFGKFKGTVKNFRVINNELYAFGVFSNTDSTPVNSIAKWSGAQWTDVYNFPCANDQNPAYINDVAIYHNNLYVGGTFDTLGFNLAVYKNGTWQQVGTGLHGGWNSIAKMAVYKDELYIAGLIKKNDGNAGQGIQKWNDTVWSEPGGSLQDINNTNNDFAQVHDMKVHKNELYVCGTFYYAGHVPAVGLAKWDGSKWCGFGTTEADFQYGFNTLGFYNDTLFISYGGDSLNGVYVDHLLRWIGGDYVDTCGNNSSVNEFQRDENDILIYPNPVTDNASIDYTITSSTNAILTVFTITGKIIANYELSSKENHFSFDTKLYDSGIYFYQLKANGEIICNNKFIIIK